jgi:hypothetical protein
VAYEASGSVRDSWKRRWVMQRFTLASVVLGIVGLFGSVRGEDPPANCSGSETYRFKLQASPDDGYTWQGGTVQIYARTYQTINRDYSWPRSTT